MTHKLKTLLTYFEAVDIGTKTFEVRENDRSFNVGDVLILQEYYDNGYSGKEINVIVTYVLYGGRFGIADGYCVMGFKKL